MSAWFTQSRIASLTSSSTGGVDSVSPCYFRSASYREKAALS